MRHLHFAQISDIHISELGDHHDMLSGRSAGFLAEVVARLNQTRDLDFVLFTGDLFDTASETELVRFEQIIQDLAKPCYIIPGNHDRRDSQKTTGLTRRDFAERFNPQIDRRPPANGAQAGYWAIDLPGEVRLIGLDSVIDGDWSGEIDPPQLDWLAEELARHPHKLTIVASHHPLHPLAPIDADPYWQRFVLTNGPQLLALLDAQPQVKLVLTGHHHQTKADWLGPRLHLAGPALAIYPCAYRTIRLTQPAGQNWRIEWQTHSAADSQTIELARELMIKAWQAVGFEAGFVAEHTRLALGNPVDQLGQARF